MRCSDQNEMAKRHALVGRCQPDGRCGCKPGEGVSTRVVRNWIAVTRGDPKENMVCDQREWPARISNGRGLVVVDRQVSQSLCSSVCVSIVVANKDE